MLVARRNRFEAHVRRVRGARRSEIDHDHRLIRAVDPDCRHVVYNAVGAHLLSVVRTHL